MRRGRTQHRAPEPGVLGVPLRGAHEQRFGRGVSEATGDQQCREAQPGVSVLRERAHALLQRLALAEEGRRQPEGKFDHARFGVGECDLQMRGRQFPEPPIPPRCGCPG